MSRTRSFGDTLAERVVERRSQLVLGLDPDPRELWPAPGQAPNGADAVTGPPREGERSGQAPPFSGAQATAAAVLAHSRAVLDAAAPACVAVKPQLARFEMLGAHGWWALEEVCEHARGHGLLVIADGKRGDIDVSARAYACALGEGVEGPFGRVGGLHADMATVNPLMGRDALEPFVAAARAAGAGVLVLVRTSNPGAADVQDLELARGGSVWERLAELVAELGAPGVGESGLSDVGAVIGATAPDHLARARELMPSAPFLLPGVGAQGGRVEELGEAFRVGRGGGLVSASRSIVRAHVESGGEPAAAARTAAERLREDAWQLSEGLPGAP